jgi:hypothetical protein
MNHQHETYDVAFSLGAACACSVALRKAKLQFASFPLDWMAGGTITERASLIATRFDRWLEKEDFEYTGTNPVNGLGMFRNKRTGMTHLHDFTDSPIEESYAKVREKYLRRTERLFSLCDNAHRILCVYVSRPAVARSSIGELHDARRLLAETFPTATVDLLHFENMPDCSLRDRRCSKLEEGLFQIEFDYHDPQRDVNINDVAAALVAEGFSAKDYRTAAEKRAYELANKMKKYRVKTRTGLLMARIIAQLQRMIGIKPKTSNPILMKP